MSLSDEIKFARQKSFFTQEAFAKELHVSTSSVIRWENGQTRPNLNAMKAIKDFCEKKQIPYSAIELAWLNKTEEV